jgi:calcium-independent phospholipase A2
MGNSPSLEIEEREASKLQTGELIQQEGPFMLYALKYTRSIWYETILNEAVFSPKYFSLFRVQDRVAAERQFVKVCTQLMPFCQGSQECYNKKTLKRLLSCLEENRQWSPAHVAVQAGIPSCLGRQEFKKHLDSTLCNGGQTPLLLACDLGDVECVKVLLELGANVEAVDGSEEKKCPVHVAAEKSPECLEAMLCSEVLVNKYGNELSHLVNNSTALNQTPLHIACRYKQTVAVQLLLSHGADSGIPDCHGLFPIHIAAKVGCRDCINVLCQYSPQKCMLKEAEHGYTPLHCTSSPECVRMLVESHKCKTEVKNVDGLTPLHTCVTQNHLAATVALLCVGANPDIKTNDGDTALHLAVKSGSVSLTQALIAFGADVHKLDNQGRTPLQLAKLVANEDNRGQYDDSGRAHIEALEAVEDLDWASLAEECRAESHGKVEGDSVLCLDGGGVRGLILVQLLSAIEKITAKRVSDLFDWIGGTSAGGILALALVHAQYSLRQCQNIFFSMKDSVFHGERPFDSKPLEDFFKLTFGEQTTMDSITRPKVLVTTTIADCLPARLHLFRNYGELEEDGEPPPSGQLVWKAARASGAAPTYFKTMGRFVDGGLIANNPALDVLSEIQQYNNRDCAGPMPPLTAVVSVGTGYPPEVVVRSVDVFRPVSIAQAAHVVMGGASLATLLLDTVRCFRNQNCDRTKVTNCQIKGSSLTKLNTGGERMKSCGHCCCHF